MKVYVRGAKTGKNITANIKGIYYAIDINYGTRYNKKLHELINLIGISKFGKPITDGGNSGAPVLDSHGNILGIIVGGNEEMSFAIPISKIFYSRLENHVL